MSTYGAALTALEARRAAESPNSSPRRQIQRKRRQTGTPQPEDHRTPSGKPLPF